MILAWVVQFLLLNLSKYTLRYFTCVSAIPFLYLIIELFTFCVDNFLKNNLNYNIAELMSRQ